MKISIFLLSAVMAISMVLPNRSPLSAMENYKDARIKEIPISMQCWTFRKFTFEETLAKVNELGIKYLEAYPGQLLSKSMPSAIFDHNMSLSQIKWVKNQLKKHGITLVSYGVVGFANTKEIGRAHV